MLATITNTVNSASVVGNQLYDPYGTNRYQAGSMATSKGFTGQYNDSLTGLDYYGSRYYDPTAGVFLSADPVQGDLAGTNPYEYVGSNPETNTDPSGQMYTPPPQGGGSPLPPVEPRGGWGNWGSGSGTSHLPPSSCGDTVQSGCLLGRLAAQTDWQGQVQVSVHIGLSNGGGLFCHAASSGVAVSVGFGGFATLSMSRTGSGCFSSGNGDVMTTTTTTVQGSSVTPVDTCFSMQCISEGAQGAADKPTDGEEVSAGSGGEELAAFFEGEGNGGGGGKGPGVGGPSDEGGPSQKEQIHPNSNAKTAFQNALNNLGRPLGDDAVRSQVKFGPAQGLDNGMREGYKFGWRLEWDPDKGAHFNWFDWTLGGKSGGGGRWGAETFPASEEQVIDMILKFTEGGEDLMLADQ